MSVEEHTAPWIMLAAFVEQGSTDAIRTYVGELGNREAARALSRMDASSKDAVLLALEPQEAADLLSEFTDAQSAELLRHLRADQAAAILLRMHSHEAADVLISLGEAGADATLGTMSTEEAQELRNLARYGRDVAGGLMITQFLAYPQDRTVADVVADMRGHSEEYSEYTIQYSYVTTDDGRLVGVLPLRDLVLCKGSRGIREIMIANPIAVRDDAPLDRVSQLFQDNRFLAVPVVDRDNRLLGVVLRADVEAAQRDQAGADYLKSWGIIGGDELRSMSTLKRSSRRLSWLSVNILLNVVAASVIAFHQDTLSSVIALAVFLPIISDMSGCSGNQAVAVSMRELTLGLLKPFEVMHVLFKELSVGIVNGIVLGLMIGATAAIWKGNPYLGLVAGGALMVNTVVAVAVGGTVPLILKRFQMDPAMASGPILTTITDMSGFMLVLTLASWMLPYLT